MIKKLALILCCLSTSVSAQDLTDRGAANLLSEIEYLEAIRKPLPGPFSSNDLRELRARTVNFVVCNGGTSDDWLKHAIPILTVAATYATDGVNVPFDPNYFNNVSHGDCNRERFVMHESERPELEQIEATLSHNDKINEAIQRRIIALNYLVGVDF